MAVSASPHRHPAVPVRRALERRWSRSVRRFREAEIAWVLALAALAALIGTLIVLDVAVVTVTALVLPLVVGHSMIGPRLLPILVGFVLVVAVAAVIANGPDAFDSRRIGGVSVTFLVGLIIALSSLRRSRLGVAGARGESMLVDLRDRISKQGGMTALPENWYSEWVMRSAGGSSFAGDFLVSDRVVDEEVLQVVVVDVSGKGERAGTRALLLSGAFGGLLGALPPRQFLSAANDYLLRQDWDEGFATAVHLTVHLGTGAFELRSAGHPPAVHLCAGSGRWIVHQVEGPILGLMEDAEFETVVGTLARGDALLMFTDGLVETPQRDISLGIDKLLGQGERLFRDGFEGGANRLIDQVETMNDDRALLTLHRR